MTSADRPVSAIAADAVLRKLGAAPFLIVSLAIVYSLFAPNFATLANLRNVLHQASLNGILAVGMTLVMLTTGIDLSVGAVVALSSVVMGLISSHAGFEWLGLIAWLPLSALIGVLNGSAVVYLRIPAFVATLASMSVARGIALTLSGGSSSPLFGAAVDTLRNLELWKIPLSVIIGAILVVGLQLVLRHTAPGLHLYALGDNALSAARSNVSVRRLTISAYTAAAILAGLAGVLLSIRLSSAQPIYGYNYELDAIAAAVVGGVSFSGGVGTVAGAALGAVAIAIMRNGLTLLDVEVYQQHIAVGLLLLVMARWYSGNR